ncbi:hypothetical protein Rctr197k_162 [Virus Rctr197k]|nr:hypothetical protein Rctr197k_162 [Virus Rctr197k]
MKTVFSQEPLTWSGPAVFLAGPTLRARTEPCGEYYASARALCPRCGGTGMVRLRSWREDALEIMADEAFQTVYRRLLEIMSALPAEDVTVIVPEFRDWCEWTATDIASGKAQVDWEDAAMERAGTLMFWVPRDMRRLPGLTTNVEYGFYLAQRPHDIVLGFPPDAVHVQYFLDKAERRLGRPIKHYNTLRETCLAALQHAQEGRR